MSLAPSLLGLIFASLRERCTSTMWSVRPRLVTARRRWTGSFLLPTDFVIATSQQQQQCSKIPRQFRPPSSGGRPCSSSSSSSCNNGSGVYCSSSRRLLEAGTGPVVGAGAYRLVISRGRRYRSSTTTAPEGDQVQDGGALFRRMARYIEEDPGAADKLGKAMDQGSGGRLKEVLDRMEYTVREPSFRELRRVAFVSAVPFVGFGMMDNAIMIVAGEYIDMTVGIAMGISTMAAAALGNTISDVAGVGLGGFIESMATKLGLPACNLSRAQMLLRTTRIAGLVGSAAGVMLGCLIGMFPLFFLPDSEVMEAVKRKEKVVGLIDAVVEEAASFLSATSATLFILDRENGMLWARRRGLPGTPHAGTLQDLKVELGHQGAVSEAARSGEAVNVRAGASDAAPSMLCMPVYGADGLVAGVVQLVGKTSNGKALDSGFTADDAKDLSALCSHISVALENIKRADEADEVDLRETISLMQSHGEVKQQHRFPQHRSSTRIGACATGKPIGISTRDSSIIAARSSSTATEVAQNK